ncbi:POU domain, class 3, transcription factor 3-like [Octopus sinensis]|uniref:POU domain protein n=1 Tax=Octopus sinensis TaxID=2607531 RepID=A0A6P7U2Z5_9MOLL|nr:POU domain, class 3, transcription factor 3-like [Octopus sinensis]
MNQNYGNPNFYQWSDLCDDSSIQGMLDDHVFTEQSEHVNDKIFRFTYYFRCERNKLGLTQSAVSSMLEKYGFTVSQTTICRFESQKLSLSSMAKLMDILNYFLVAITSSQDCPQRDYFELSMKCRVVEKYNYKRRKRTCFTEDAKEYLHKLYRNCQKPSNLEMTRASHYLGIQIDILRVWFCNRRQKDKKKRHDQHRGDFYN